MQKFALLFVALCLTGFSAFATRPLKRHTTFRQSDGGSVTLVPQGNAQFGYYTTADGYAVLPDASGRFCYALWVGDELQPSAQLAHNVAERTLAERHFVAAQAVDGVQAFERLGRKGAALRVAATGTYDGITPYGQTGPGTVQSVGAPVIPVIMVEFADKQFLPGTTEEKVTRFFNEHGYADEEYTKGSVADYFRDQSYGLFQPRFEVVGKVTASHGYAYYGSNSGSSRDVRVRSLVSEALQLAVAAGVDFSPYATGGRVPLVSIMHAGEGEHNSAYITAAANDFIWAHFSTGSFSAGEGVSVASYFIGNEAAYEIYDDAGRVHPTDDGYETFGEKLDGMGVFCHEFGHALGLPDFYYTGSSAAIADTILSMDYWSVMDYGQYMFDGYCPVGYNAYERAFLGWQKVEPLTDKGYYTIDPADGTEVYTAYKLQAADNASSYFLLDNRQVGTWTPSLMGHGMLVLHINYDGSIWSRNRVNLDPNAPRFTYVPADRQKQGPNSASLKWADYKGDLFGPAQTEFTQEAFSGFLNTFGIEALPAELYDIHEAGGSIVFSYADREVTAVKQPSRAGGQPASVYSLDGRQLSSPAAQKGIYLLRQDGAVRKLLVR